MSDFSRNTYTNVDRLKERVADRGHRKVIGGRWDQLGNLQLDFLVQRGLQPHHALLDVGCGPLRAGVKLVPYLDPGNYYGIDLSDILIEAGYEGEIVPNGLEDRLPRANLAVNSSFDASGFGRRFDFAIAQSVFTHVPWNDIRLCLEMLSDVMADDGPSSPHISSCPKTRCRGARSSIRPATSRRPRMPTRTTTGCRTCDTPATAFRGGPAGTASGVTREARR
jgi:cyclopropane fatty-acyl-phospholipid synthase-like methyltransferase